uniref:Interferon-induced GTP-binding protein Mx1-like n=1 Tax=Sinocyclocheilus grahami TaxID=75366 RepID=A0A672MJP7_SINGR
ELFSFSESQTHGAFHNHFIESVRPLIELIDSLKLIGLDEDIGLPSIAVVGDQSSGKSSVLEALSGVALPRGSGIVTRCPLELKLQKLKNGPWSGIISYSGHRETFNDPLKVDTLVREAQNKLAGKAVGICDELITLEISSPDVCDLTLIDLPGITRVPVHDQPEDIGDQIKTLILKYIAKSETIILVVVPCNVDIATTEALRMAQKVDPEGLRTLAILTKPDLIDRGAEIDVLNIVQGKVIPLSKGYIIVRCRGQSDINDRIPFDKAMEAELKFFRNHHYFRYLMTYNILIVNITCMNSLHIKKSLPSLTEQIQTRLLNVQRDLKNYEQGPPLEEEMMGPFLSEVRALRVDHHKCYLSRNNVIAFKIVTEMIEKYNEIHRGRELLTFSEFCEYECVIQNHVAALQEPAMATLKDVRGTVSFIFIVFIIIIIIVIFHVLPCIPQNMVNDIQTKQEAKAEKRIKEFINMEKLVFTQDKVLQQKLNDSDIPQKTGIETSDKNHYDDDDTIFNSKGCALLDTRNLVPEKLVLYYETLRHQMMELRNGADVVKLLSEDSEHGRMRADLKQRLERLTQAQDLISNRL